MRPSKKSLLMLLLLFDMPGLSQTATTAEHTMTAVLLAVSANLHQHSLCRNFSS